jgi:hypothetical protein
MKFYKSLFLLKNTGILFVVLLVMSMAGCKKLVEVDAPITNPSSTGLYTSDALAASVLTSIYTKMATSNTSFAQGTGSISLYAGLSADELKTYNISGTSYMSFYQNNIPVTFSGLWQGLYENIYITNAAIEGIEKSSGGMTDSVKKQLTGEAKFMRAFLHFYVINLFGDAPLITTTEYRNNSVITRTPKAQVYEQIIADLKDAQNLLKENYVLPTGAMVTSTGTAYNERVRPIKWAATALLARVYLYTGNWINAEAEASALITNTSMYKLEKVVTNVFLRNSTEAIWQIQSTRKNYNTLDGTMFFRTAAPTAVTPADLQPAFMSNFVTADQRRRWTDSITLTGMKYYFPAKYKVRMVTGLDTAKPANEHLTVFRLAEQYLIRAEARAQQHNLTGAKADIDTIRARAGLTPTPANDQTSILNAIMKERQVELFTEWGHRWFDLKRTNQVDAVMSVMTPLKGGTWNTNMQLYPIPGNDILLNPNLAPQNPGYN